MVSRVQSISFSSKGSARARSARKTDEPARAIPEFFFGPENALLSAAVEPLVRGDKCPFQPLVFVGPSGVGKSHLASGIAASATNHPILHLSAADFAREATAVTNPVDAADRHRTLHAVETLILEDVHQLKKKPAAQAALSTLFDALVARGATVIVTSDRLPAKLEGFSPALVGRLSSGLVVTLSPPCPAVRKAMIAHIADCEGLSISSGATERLSTAPLASWNELRGALLALRFASGQNNTPIRATDVRRYLAEKPDPDTPEIRDIAIAAAKHFGLSLSDLRSASRRRTVVDARNITAHLARTHLGQSLQQIGQYLGGRDHTTILHGIRKVDEQLERDPALRQTLDELMQSIVANPRSQSWKTRRTTVHSLSPSDAT